MLTGGFSRGNPPAHWHSIDTINSGLVAPQQTALTSSLFVDNNYAIYCPIIVRNPALVRKLWVAVDTIGTGNLDIGLFSAAGVKLTSSGSTAHGTTLTELVTDVTDIVISPGVYYLALASSTYADTFFGVSVSAPYLTAIGYYVEASAFPLPATATFALRQTLAFVPTMGLLTNTLVS